ncbi:hypothetical protein GCM10010406_29300 [Streptomyces thermolineatus]|uniref:Integral membrane protein n=1 Tax=Streptomyces thermolineatus TaxID=44033 RepID=A0ABP5Z4X6_9ACTN
MTRRNGKGRQPVRRGNARSFNELPGTRGRVRRRRLWGVVALVLGLNLLPVSVAGFFSLPDLVEEVRAFRSAAECGDLGEAEGQEWEGWDCLGPAHATVRSVVIKKKAKSSEFKVFLNGPDGVPDELSFNGDSPVLEFLEPGDRVRVTMWRHYAVAITHDGLTQATNDDPEGLPEVSTGLMLVLLTAGGCLVWLGGHLTVSARDVAAYGPPLFYPALGRGAVWVSLEAVPAGLAGAAVSRFAESPAAGPVVTAGVWLVLALVTVLVLLRREFLRREAPGTGRGRRARR